MWLIDLRRGDSYNLSSQTPDLAYELALDIRNSDLIRLCMVKFPF